jgi:predicted AlkP superfamily phosphohydrolase/phosphomutase
MIDDDTTIFLISDHGFGPKKRVFKINEWLLKEGYLKVNTVNNHQDARSSYLSRTFLKFPLMRSLRRFLPFQIQQYFRERLNKYRVNWEQTRVFTQPSEENYGDLYINLKYEGFKDNNYQEEYDKIVNEVIEKLTNFKDEKTGNNIPLKVLKRNDVYKGEYLNEAPDLIVLTDSNINGFNANIGNSKIFEIGKGGDHRMEGIFVAHGPNIRKNVETRDVDVYDVTPTLLHIFNSPISSSIDGKVIKEIFEKGSDPETRDVSYTLDEFKQFNEDNDIMTDEEEIKNRLKKLGYI